jgi:hypothetical protein
MLLMCSGQNRLNEWRVERRVVLARADDETIEKWQPAPGYVQNAVRGLVRRVTATCLLRKRLLRNGLVRNAEPSKDLESRQAGKAPVPRLIHFQPFLQ